MSLKHTFFRNLSCIEALIIFFLSYACWSLHNENVKEKRQSKIVYQSVIQYVGNKIATFKEVAKNQDMVLKKEAIILNNDTSKRQRFEKLPIFKTTDSIAALQAQKLFFNKRIEKYIRDSTRFVYALAVQKHKTDSVIKGNQNLTFIVTSLDQRLSEYDSIKASKSINTLVAEPVKIRRSKFFFSKQDDFLKLRKLGDTASINGTNYILYPTENKYTNQLLFQMRSSFNYATDKFSFGPGVELKFGSKGLNVAYLGNPADFGNYFQKASLVFGFRVDVLHTTFQSKKFMGGSFSGAGSSGYYGQNAY